jgi:hypothetical protein
MRTEFPGVFPRNIDKAIQAGGALPSDLSADKRRARSSSWGRLQERGYAAEMGTRPQTLCG